MLHAQQRLCPDNLPCAAHLNLVVKLEPVLDKRISQIRLNRCPGGGCNLHSGFIKSQRVSTCRLGIVHRQVDLFEDAFNRVVAVTRKQGDADARGAAQRIVSNLEDRLKALDNLLANQLRHCCRIQNLVAQILKHHDELVTANTCNRGALADAATQPGGDQFQDLVAHIVAQGVVQQFEVIQVHQQQCAILLAATMHYQCLPDTIRQELAIRQFGQLVVIGQMMDVGLGRLLLGDVFL